MPYLIVVYLYLSEVNFQSTCPPLSVSVRESPIKSREENREKYIILDVKIQKRKKKSEDLNSFKNKLRFLM